MASDKQETAYAGTLTVLSAAVRFDVLAAYFLRAKRLWVWTHNPIRSWLAEQLNPGRIADLIAWPAQLAATVNSSTAVFEHVAKRIFEDLKGED